MKRGHRADRTGRNNDPGRHVRIYHYVLKTAAWQSLDPYARALYVEIAARYGGPGSNNGRLIFSCRQAAERLGISKNRAAKSFAQLEDRRFIVAVQRGGFNRKGNAAHHATTWRLTEFGCDVTLKLATKEFTRWTPPEKIQRTVRSEDHMVRLEDQPVRSEDQPGIKTSLRSSQRTETISEDHSAVRSEDTASIPGGLRSAPIGSAVASEPPGAISRADALAMIMRMQGCNATEAAAIFDGMPDAPSRTNE
jgi:hypothetical protein